MPHLNGHDVPRCESIGPLRLGVEPDLLQPGRGDREGGGAGGGDLLQGDQVDAAAGDVAVGVWIAAGVAGVAAAGDEEEVSLRAPAVLGAGADGFGEVPQGAAANVRTPVADAAGVVVAVVRGGALVHLPVGAEAQLHALPVVVVIALVPHHRQVAQGRRVGVVGPVLDVEVAGALAGAVDARGFAALRLIGTAVDYV